jgi:tetratricopeptide (TPR) repeat protein
MLEAGETLVGAPETLQGVVAARIDSLPADEKELLQQASVLGKVFWTDALAAHFDGEAWVLEERLHALERKEFVRREHRSAVEGARQYTFVHALVRDGAYGQMPRAVRARAHERIAEWIASLPSDRAEDRAEMLAHHLIEAVEFGRAAGLDVSELTPRAAEAARDAGDRSWALGAPGAALASYERARSLDPTLAEDPYLLLRLGHALLLVHQRGEDELDHAASSLAVSDPAAAAEAVIIRGEVVWQRGDQAGGFAYFERAAAMVEELPASRRKLLVTSNVARFLTLAGRADEGLEHAERAIAMARELGDDELLGDSLNTRGIARSSLGDPGALADIEQSLALALELNSWRASRAYNNLASVLATERGDIRRADATLREGVEFDERLGSRLLLRWLKGSLAETAFHLGLWEEALQLAEGEIGDPEPHYMQQPCRNVRAWIRLARDDVRGARDDVDRALRDARQIRDPQVLVPALTASAFFAAATGDTARANKAIDELDTTLVEVGRATAGLAGGWVVELAFALLELGRERELEGRELGPATPWRDAAEAIANDELVRCADTLAVIGSAAWEAQGRLWAARRLSSRGLLADFQAQLASALAFYRLVGASRAVREGEALLAAG